MTGKKTVLTFENVQFSYPDQPPAINQLSFDLYCGEKLAFIGPNGAGKSTLITLINGVNLAEGRIKITDLLLSKENLPEIKRRVGIVFQNPDDQLFCPTLFEDIAFGPMNFGYHEEEIRHRVAQALDQTGLKGYESRSSLHLSFGEKKLASIATVLATNPDIIAFDEPSSNLDPYHRRKIIHWIRSSEKSFIIATHDLDMVAEIADRVIILSRGQIAAEGSVPEILKDRDLLETYQLELPICLQSIDRLAEYKT